MFRIFKKKQSGGEKRNLLIYGLQRSGTNYLESLIRSHFPACIFLNGDKRDAITHKHFRLYTDKRCIPEPQFQNSMVFASFREFESQLPAAADLYLVISKDPYNWLISYNKWSEKNKWPPHNYHYIEEYNLFYGAWMDFSRQSKKVLLLRYADLLQEPLATLNTIGRALHLAELTSVAAPKKVYASRRFSAHKKKEYLNQASLRRLPPPELELLNMSLDKDLAQSLGYEIREAYRDADQ
jgi:hypothetical protein